MSARFPDPTAAALTDEAVRQAQSVAIAIFYAGPDAAPVAYAKDIPGSGRRVLLTAAGVHGRLETTWSVEQARELCEALAVVLAAEGEVAA